jgi:hypothetical protein
MKFLSYVLSGYLIFQILSGCGKDDIPVDKDNLIEGNWEFTVSSEEPGYTLYHLKRTDKLSEKYGSMNFNEDRSYSFKGAWGFTGQPWLFTGTWSVVNDTLISVEMIQPFQETWKMAITKLDKKYLDYYYQYDK